jgi:flagellar hook-basal body complex protein FliE
MQIRPDSLFARHTQRAREQTTGSLSSSPTGAASDFFNLMKDGIGRVNEMQNQSEIGVEKMLTGQDVQSAEVMTSLQKADMAFRLLVQIRNKLMDAYQEINGIRI